MTKTYKKRASKSSAAKTMNEGLKTASVAAKDVANETIPIVEKGVSAVYGTMATGFNLGVKGAKNVAKGAKNIITKSKKSRKSRKSRK